MKSLHRHLSSLAVATLVFAASAICHAQIVTLAEFAMNGTSTEDLLKPSKQNASVTVSGITANKVTLGKVGSEAAYRLSVATTVGRPTSSIDTALTDADYFSFTISPNDGQALTLNKITFRAAAGGDATPRTFYLFSSIDGFQAPSLIISGTTGTGDNDLKNWATSLTEYTHSFSGAQYQDITSPITFRIYVQTRDATQTLIFDDIRVEGSVSASTIPEPTSLALLVGCATLLVTFIAHRRIR